MLTTPEQVKAMTGYDVTADLINMAQFVVEAFTGKPESDITDPNDLRIVGMAVTFQSAYMSDNYEKVYEQVAFVSKAYSDGSLTPDRQLFSPFLAPLAAYCLSNVSWLGTRSVHTGPLYDRGPVESWATV